jgi:hypothetical protein
MPEIYSPVTIILQCVASKVKSSHSLEERMYAKNSGREDNIVLDFTGWSSDHERLLFYVSPYTRLS